MKVSVIVPIYNTEKYLARCLNSIIYQTIDDIEIILVNDGSTDSCIDIVNKFAKLDSRIIVIDKVNSGLSAARNSGINIAKGEYILHIDSDDWIELNYIQDIYEYAKKLNLDIVVTDAYWDWDNGYIKYTQDLNIKENNIISGIEYLDYFFKGKARPVVWNKLFKRTLYKENNIQHPDGISLGEDLATTPKLAFHAKRVGKLNKAYLHYIQNPNSITKSTSSKNIEELTRVISSLRSFFREYNLDILELRTLFYIVSNFDNMSNNDNIKTTNRFITLCKETPCISHLSYKVKFFVFFVKLIPKKNTIILLITFLKKIGVK